METPSSTTRRVTRSQTKQANLSRKMEESKHKSLKKDRSVLIDITNDSPIVGLASGTLATPISLVAKRSRNHCKLTPGSGEALLRCQVKTLLQKVEEEGEVSKFDIGSGNVVKCFDRVVVAPTPANTPQVLNFSSDLDEFCSFTCVSQSPIQDLLTVSQVMKGNHDVKKETAEVGLEAEKDVMISRALFLDFSEKSDSSSECSSVVTCQGPAATIETESHEKSGRTSEDDDASLWSIQVNASTCDEDEDGDDTEVIDDDVASDNDGSYSESELVDIDELCDEMSKISVNGEKQGVVKFTGKHIRFVYNSDDELVEESEECGFEEDSSEILHLKGLPTPKGKHLRFQDGGDEQ